jgi:hypothetical protein
VAGSVRKGGGLLVGLLRCGHCGRKLKVLHHARRDTRYICNAEMDYASDKKCITFSNMRVDAAVSAEVLRAISPLAIDAALQLIADRERADAERLRQSELALEQARYEATHARRQYDWQNDRVIAIGRKNYLFAGSDAGGRRAAAIYGLIESAKLNGLNPQHYLADVLARIADHPARRIAELLPWNWQPMDTTRAAA